MLRPGDVDLGLPGGRRGPRGIAGRPAGANDSLRGMERRCLRGSNTPFAEDLSAKADLSVVRYRAVLLADALLDNSPACEKYQEACSYLRDLFWYLLQTDYAIVKALTPMLDLSRPLRESHADEAELSENLAALEAWLAAEEGTDVPSTLRPYLNESTN